MKPIILLAFANDRSRPLDTLHEERENILEKLRLGVEEELCEVHVLDPADIDGILGAFQTYADQVAVFHYAGHAGSFELCLQDAGGRQEIAHAGGFAEFLSLQRGLQLVFLNGCSTQAQVEDLMRAKVGAVIATSQAINDEVATRFSTQFYQSLGLGNSINKSFQEAAAAVKMKMGASAGHRGIYYKRPVEQLDRFPWDFYVNEGADIIREWNLPQAAGNPLFGMPKPPQLDLPDIPFRYLHWFHPEDAEIFFGRAYQIRELYDKIMDPHTPGVIHLYGRSGVGKSSLLAAGLFPRLQADHEVSYLRRSQEQGLLPPLAAVFNVPADPAAITAAWRTREAAAGRPLTIILDQVEELFTRPLAITKETPDEMEALLTIARQFQAPGSRLRGKLILSYRKEYLAELESRFVQDRIAYDKLFLENLNRNDVLAAVTGLTLAPRTREKYQLQFEEGLPEIIADDLLEDPDSPIAPVLQILLSKMWDETPLREGRRSFTIGTYQQLKKKGLLLGDFLLQKLDELKTWNRKFVESGLVLDLLLFHTTSKGTAARRSLREMEDRYPQHARGLAPLLTELKNKYLLVEVAAQNGEGHDFSLAHDTLAPLLLEMSQLSDYPAQKANRILTNKVADWESGAVAEALDATDLKAVEDGQWGMRAWTEDEQKLVAASRERRARARRTRRRVIAGGIVMLLLIVGASIFAWIQRGIAEANATLANQRARVATSNSLAATSFVEQDINPTASFRLAEYGLAYDSANVDAYSALLQAFYSGAYFFDGRWHGAPFYLDGQSTSAPPDYRASEYVIYAYPAGDDFSDNELQRAEARLATLLAGRNSALFSQSEFGSYSLQKAVFSPKKRFLLLALDSGSDFTVPLVEVWDLTNDGYRYNFQEPLCQQELTYSQIKPEAFSTANFSYDDRYVALPRADAMVFIELNPDAYNSVKEVPFQLSSSTSEVLQVFFHKEGYRVTAVDARGETATWDLSLHPVPAFEFRGETDILADSSGRYLVTVKEKQVNVWDLAGKRLGPGVLTPDRGALLDAPGGEKQTSLTRVIDRKWHATYPESVLLRDTSGDGRLIISAEREDEYGTWGAQVARITNAKGDTLLTLRGHANVISSVAISPDRRYFLTATCPKGNPPQTKLWDAGGKELLSLTGFGGKVGFLPSGDAFYTYRLQCCAECDYDDEVNVWSIDPERLLTQVNAAGVHRLNEAEMTRYGIDPEFLKEVVAAVPATEKKTTEAPAAVRQAYITGSGVNVRSEPRVGDNVVGLLDEGTRVDLLEERVPESAGDTYVCRIATVMSLDGGGEQPLGAGRAVSRLPGPENDSSYLVEVEINGVRYRGTVPAADIQPMQGVSWYRVRSGDLVGWVYGTFVKEL